MDENSPREQTALHRLAEETSVVDEIMRRGLTEDRAEAIIWANGYFEGRDSVIREQAAAAASS
ncbi:hypothetical protein [Rhodococcoides fascians]|uniref:hypothetical protein n=1 Tax=Rhodococcoides fascians TaxID=1828 RepID=UPI0024BB4BE6|nr:hypothetical protein [Rhodococcus fascians]MDJ0412073.1 hypothetical protein [Rhodococcus fascians]